MKRSPITIESYDPAWAEQYAREERQLRTVFGDEAECIAHIGSTSVPGLAADPIIDVMIVVENLDTARAFDDDLVSIGYVCIHDSAERQWIHYRRQADNGQLFNLHVFPIENEMWRADLLFREYLREHPEMMAEYEALKRTLVENHRDDIVKYARTKGAFIRSVVERARDSDIEVEPDQW